MVSNSMMIIAPYRSRDTWVFDDPNTELVSEPFVEGIPEMIDILVKDIPNANDGFKMLFSGSPFPGYQAKLNRLNSEYGGTWYSWEQHKMTGWLCPALFKYFTEAPPELYFKAEPLR